WAYMPFYQELVLAKELADREKVLRDVVTDELFRKAAEEPEPKEGATPEEDRKARQEHRRAVAKARALSWALAYYLFQQKLPELEGLVRELETLPRDLELSADAKLRLFAKAFK